jgi:hypothetical protein
LALAWFQFDQSWLVATLPRWVSTLPVPVMTSSKDSTFASLAAAVTSALLSSAETAALVSALLSVPV